ncbi:GNAT family N-acetyltransferase [Paenibacillus sp. JW14]|uniref:GNAT family N-acetyltransferase n=1 Tax=Paenibacillus agri TaxID=2744309 RepID=A0A850EWT9_9BACL|nr:GNAT family N-acetyltransferase [Paenibacillus agri]
MSKNHRRKWIGSILLQHAEEVVKSCGACCLLTLPEQSPELMFELRRELNSRKIYR